MADNGSKFRGYGGYQVNVAGQDRSTAGEEQPASHEGILEPDRSTTDNSAGQHHHGAAESLLSNTEASSSHPKRTHSTIKFSDGYLDTWRQRHSPKMTSPSAKGRGRWEGVWLSRGTLRRIEVEERGSGEDLWKFVWRKLKNAKAGDIRSESAQGRNRLTGHLR